MNIAFDPYFSCYENSGGISDFKIVPSERGINDMGKNLIALIRIVKPKEKINPKREISFLKDVRVDNM